MRAVSEMLAQDVGGQSTWVHHNMTAPPRPPTMGILAPQIAARRCKKVAENRPSATPLRVSQVARGGLRSGKDHRVKTIGRRSAAPPTSGPRRSGWAEQDAEKPRRRIPPAFGAWSADPLWRVIEEAQAAPSRAGPPGAARTLNYAEVGLLDSGHIRSGRARMKMHDAGKIRRPQTARALAVAKRPQGPIRPGSRQSGPNRVG